ncbi:MAG TPA: type II secretion system F family protein [Longimicrobiales bacterium]
MIFVVVGLIATTVALLVVAATAVIPARPRALDRQLAELERLGVGSNDAPARRRRQAGREQFETLVRVLGERIQRNRTDSSEVRQFLVRAGYRKPSAVTYYWGIRAVLVLGLGAAGIVLLPLFGARMTSVALGTLWLAALGWIAPTFAVRHRMRKRQKDLQKALPDTLDLLVVCVEAGLGLNHALLRVSQEIHHVSRNMSEELALVNLEIRTGSARDEALRNLGERTGLTDFRALTAMLIQTDRFGTSIARALRVHADALRTKRRQRAEEAAAKTTIKLVFPLVFCIFPALFVVVLGPALIQIFEALRSLV